MASKGVNKVIVLGRVGQDPDIRYSPSGKAFASLSVATSEQWRDKQTGEQKELTEWHKVSIVGKLAEIAGQYVKKGDQVYFEGQLRTRKWQDSQGNDRYTTEILVGMNGVMQMLGARQGGTDPDSATRKSGQQQRAAPQQQHQSAPPMDFDDDIPFAPATLPFPSHAVYAI